MAGINAAEGRLIESDGAPISLVRRFDRPDAGGRLMYVSAATMLGAEDGDPGNHTYCEIADALRKYGAATQNDIDELWRRIAFSILITNVDDHLRNHGFLHIDHGQWRLAPAFDLNPFPDRLRELKTWVSEDTGPESTVDALMSVTSYFRMAAPHARKMLGRVERAVARWRAEGRVLGMSSVELDRFADAFEHPERAAARRTLSTR
jgi:serine/threonine-protein kinase HipA